MAENPTLTVENFYNFVVINSLILHCDPKVMTEYENLRTADIIAEALLDWKVEVIFGLPGDGINGFIEALRRRKDKIKFILVRHEE